MTADPPPILIVEDNPTARKMFRVTLEAEGHRVLEAADGRSALAHLVHEVPALVLQDLVLPDRDGLELARAMRTVPGCAELPIVVMSGFPRLLDRARNEPGCFNASLVKPVAPSLLVDLVRRYIAAPRATVDAFGRGKKILIVDDDPIQLKLARLRFGEVGFEVVIADDGPSALALAISSPPDVVVCDVLMPGTDGYELCVSFRDIPRLASIPFILVSAHYGGSADEALSRAAGANALVTRSPTLIETLEAVRTCLAGPPAAPPKDPEFGRHHADRVIAQLKRQAGTHAGIAKRAALQTAQLSVLAGIADALARSRDIEEALADVLAASLEAGGITRSAMFRVDAFGHAALSFASGFPEAAVTGLAGLFGFGRLFEADHGAVVLPLESLSLDEAATFLDRVGVETVVLVPIMDGTFRTGWLVLGTSNPEIHEQDLATFGRLIGAHIAQALALTEAFTRLQDAAEASRLLSASLDVYTTQTTLGRLATGHLAQLCEIRIGSERPVVSTAVTLPAEVSAVLAELAAGYPGIPVVVAAGAADPGKRSVVLGAPTDGGLGEAAVDARHLELLRALSIDAVAIVPLVASDHHLGTVAFARLRGARAFRDTDVVAMEELTRRAAIAIDNARLYESARAANRAKDEFLATVSHELRSPLNAMLGWAQMLASGLPAEKHDKAIRAIERNAFAQAALIDDLLDMSRIVSGTMRLEVQPLELGPIVAAAIESLKPQLEAKRIVLRPLRKTSAQRVIGDPGRMQQIVYNLLSNAIKFTPANGHITLALAEHAHELALTVTDDGQGIDPAFLAHVFERFKQADGSTSRAHGGLGLGLAITRHLVELHGGTIRAESEGPGRGATFTVTLPGAGRPAASQAPERVEPAAGRPRTALDGISILVVDDEPDARDMLVSLLEGCGASTRTASGAAEALQEIDEHRPDVVVSDLGMPGEDGYSLIRKIRLRPQCGELPAIAVSGFAGVDDRRKAITAGFHVHLAKPVKLGELLSTIVKVKSAAAR